MLLFLSNDIMRCDIMLFLAKKLRKWSETFQCTDDSDYALTSVWTCSYILYTTAHLTSSFSPSRSLWGESTRIFGLAAWEWAKRGQQVPEGPRWESLHSLRQSAYQLINSSSVKSSSFSLWKHALCLKCVFMQICCFFQETRWNSFPRNETRSHCWKQN